MRTPTNSQSSNDPPWHFWTAQLIHYGLTPTKDKNAAKIRLLSALNEGILEVPGWIIRLETELKKEWEAEKKKLNKPTKGLGAPRTPARQKAVAAQSSPLNISVKIDLSQVMLATHSATPSVTSKSTATKRKRYQLEPSSPASPAKKPRPRVKKEQVVEAEPRSSFLMAGSGPGDIVLSGTYDVGKDWIMHPVFDADTDGPFQLDVFMDGATGIWWAKFHWAMLDGIMKMDPGPSYETATHFQTLGWRIRNEDTGKLTFGRNCTGKFRFDQETGTPEGYLYDVPGAGRIDFQGNRVPGPRKDGDLSREWDYFVEEAYGATRY